MENSNSNTSAPSQSTETIAISQEDFLFVKRLRDELRRKAATMTDAELIVEIQAHVQAIAMHITCDGLPRAQRRYLEKHPPNVPVPEALVAKMLADLRKGPQ